MSKPKPLSWDERRAKEKAADAARWDMTVEEFERQSNMCRQYCHPETCNHPWAK